MTFTRKASLGGKKEKISGEITTGVRRKASIGGKNEKISGEITTGEDEMSVQEVNSQEFMRILPPAGEKLNYRR